MQLLNVERAERERLPYLMFPEKKHEEVLFINFYQLFGTKTVDINLYAKVMNDINSQHIGKDIVWV